MKNTVHFTLQGKGGVGKSFVSSLLTQYFQDKNEDVFCADTDPVNQTFASYAEFEAQTINILNDENTIDSRAFDELVERIVAHEGPCVIDNGASTFVPLSAYMKESDLVNILGEMGKTVYIHCVVTGGQAMQDTLAGLASLFSNQSAPIVVWENEFFGNVKQGEKEIKDFKVYSQNKSRIPGIIKIQRRTNDTYGKDIENMVKQKLTFRQAMENEEFGLMPRQRLKQVQSAIYNQLDEIVF